MKAIIQAIADRMIAADEPGFTAADLQVGTAVMQYLESLPPHIQKDIRQLIVLFEYLPPLIIFKPSRFTRLRTDDRDRYIAAWAKSRVGLLRSGFRVLKSLCVSAYYQNPASWDAIGYKR